MSNNIEIPQNWKHNQFAHNLYLPFLSSVGQGAWPYPVSPDAQPRKIKAIFVGHDYPHSISAIYQCLYRDPADENSKYVRCIWHKHLADALQITYIPTYDQDELIAMINSSSKRYSEQKHENDAIHAVSEFVKDGYELVGWCVIPSPTSIVSSAVDGTLDFSMPATNTTVSAIIDHKLIDCTYVLDEQSKTYSGIPTWSSHELVPVYSLADDITIPELYHFDAYEFAGKRHIEGQTIKLSADNAQVSVLVQPNICKLDVSLSSNDGKFNELETVSGRRVEVDDAVQLTAEGQHKTFDAAPIKSFKLEQVDDQTAGSSSRFYKCAGWTGAFGQHKDVRLTADVSAYSDNSTSAAIALFERLSSDVKLSAEYAKPEFEAGQLKNVIKYIVDSQAGESESVTVTAPKGTDYALSAIPAAGYKFTSWKNDASTLSARQGQILWDNSKDFTAKFSKLDVQLQYVFPDKGHILPESFKRQTWTVADVSSFAELCAAAPELDLRYCTFDSMSCLTGDVAGNVNISANDFEISVKVTNNAGKFKLMLSANDGAEFDKFITRRDCILSAYSEQTEKSAVLSTESQRLEFAGLSSASNVKLLAQDSGLNGYYAFDGWSIEGQKRPDYQTEFNVECIDLETVSSAVGKFKRLSSLAGVSVSAESWEVDPGNSNSIDCTFNGVTTAVTDALNLTAAKGSDFELQANPIAGYAFKRWKPNMSTSDHVLSSVEWNGMQQIVGQFERLGLCVEYSFDKPEFNLYAETGHKTWSYGNVLTYAELSKLDGYSELSNYDLLKMQSSDIEILPGSEIQLQVENPSILVALDPKPRKLVIYTLDQQERLYGALPNSNNQVSVSTGIEGASPLTVDLKYNDVFGYEAVPDSRFEFAHWTNPDGTVSATSRVDSLVANWQTADATASAFFERRKLKDRYVDPTNSENWLEPDEEHYIGQPHDVVPFERISSDIPPPNCFHFDGYELDGKKLDPDTQISTVSCQLSVMPTFVQNVGMLETALIADSDFDRLNLDAACNVSAHVILCSGTIIDDVLQNVGASQIEYQVSANCTIAAVDSDKAGAYAFKSLSVNGQLQPNVSSVTSSVFATSDGCISSVAVEFERLSSMIEVEIATDGEPNNCSADILIKNDVHPVTAFGTFICPKCDVVKLSAFADADAGYAFACWKNGEEEYAEPTIDVNVDWNDDPAIPHKYVAEFRKNVHVTYYANVK